MAALTRWDPFRELEEFSRRLAPVLGRTPDARDGGREWMTVAEWAPVVDIIEDDKEYLIKAELPEVEKNDVRVTVENGVLTITGERRAEKEENGKRYRRVERSYGNFVRSFTVPDDADAGKVAAEFKDGLLKVRLPKSEEAKPRQIEVKVA